MSNKTDGTERERVEGLREKLEDGAGEIAVRFDDACGHQYWEWRNGEIVRLTHPDFNNEGEYNGPWKTETHLLRKMVGDGDTEIVGRENTPFGERSRDTGSYHTGDA